MQIIKKWNINEKVIDISSLFEFYNVPILVFYKIDKELEYNYEQKVETSPGKD